MWCISSGQQRTARETIFHETHRVGSSRLQGSGGALPQGQDTRSQVPVEESVERGYRRAGKSRIVSLLPCLVQRPVLLDR
jgi:hypothetical protein